MRTITKTELGDLEMKLVEFGKSWAKTYSNGRLTGELVADPVLMDNGDIAPGFLDVGDWTEEEFENEFEWQQHDHCHSSTQPDFSCRLCIDAGWV